MRGKKKERTVKESMLMVEGKRDEKEYGVNYRMRAVSSSGSFTPRIFSSMVFTSSKVLHYTSLTSAAFPFTYIDLGNS